MRHILFLLFIALTLQAFAQYPATGNKARLGWQTTGDGLVYRGAIGDTATLDPSGLNNAWMLLDTANGNLYAYRAKAWRLVSGGGGSVSDTLTGEVKGPLDSTYIDTVANIIFTTTTDTTVGVGELEYNDTQGSLIQGLKGGNVTNVIGQQIHQRVLNKTGSPLAKGEAVYLQGSQGNRITVAKAIATVDSTSANTFGIVAESIADNQSGYIITEGLITGLNTNSLTEGAAVYLSPTVAGELTTTKPQAPQHTVYIGVCVKQNAGSGELFVKIRNGQELDELHDVRITSPASNASLYYNTSESVWRDTGAAVLVADTSVMLSPYLKKADTLSLSNRINTKLNISDTSVFARDFQISGTTNRLAMFTGSNTVGNSVVDVTSDTVSIRDYSNSYTTWRFHSNINKRGFIGYPSGTRFYSLVNPSLYAGFMYGDRSAGAQDQQAFTQLTAWNGGGASSGFFSAATTLNGSDSTLYFNISGLSANANPTFPAAQMVIQKGGNVGIATSSPSYKLDVNGTAYINDTLTTRSQNNVAWLRVLRNTGTTIQQRFVNAQNTAYTATSGTVSPTWTNVIDNDNSDFMISSRLVAGTGGNIILDAPEIGINTVSPSRPLHVAGTTAIRIPVGNLAQRGTSDNGDIRVRTDTASMEYYSGAWRTVAPMARVPQSGLANRFSKFNADGLLDTSAVLVQVNGRIGINAATPQVALEINGRMRLSRGTNNTFIGIDAGNDTITGNRNIGIGNGTLSLIGSGTFNIGIGSQVLAANTTGSNNFGIGVQSLLKNTTGSSNVSFGVAAMFENTTGSGNLAIGTSALNKNTTASNNVGIGYAALYNNTIGENNVALGYQALFSSTIVSQNVAIGTGALQTTTGEKSTAIGAYALQSATTGTQNLAIGNNAAVLVAVGSNNTILGSGAAITTSSNSNNTQMDNAVIIGQDARPSASGNSNEIVIGYQGRGNGSNTTTIGNSSTTKTFFQYGETYIGTTTDNGSYNLQVGGNIKATGNISRKSAIVTTSNYTVLDEDTWITCVGSNRITLTLPSASTWPGREIVVQTGTAFGVVSNSSNVYETSSVYSFADTSIIKADYPYAWVKLVSDGTGWIKIQRSPYIITKSITLDFPAVAAQSSYTFSNTFVGGASIGDVVSIGVPSGMPANTIFTGQVSTTDGTVDVKMHNYGTTTTANPPSATFKIAITKF